MHYSVETLEFPRLTAVLSGFADSEPGRERIQQMAPVSDVQWVEAELGRVEEARALRDRGVSLGFGGGRDIRPSLRRAAVAGASLQAEEFLAVLHHLQSHSAARRMFDRERERVPGLFAASVELTPLPDLEEAIQRVLTPEGAIRDTASAELKRIRRSLLEVRDTLRKRLEALTLRYAKAGFLRGETFTIRDGRYVLPVRAEDLRKVKGIVHDRSATGGTVFIEPAALIDLGNELRQLELAERDEERRILTELTGELRRRLKGVETNGRVMALMDELWSKAKLAELLDAYPPRVLSRGAVRLVGARHPLLILDGKRKVVPLDLELGERATTLVISGPNAGGKSVALKCIGFHCLMALCGLPVPALPGTEIPLFGAIYADIGDQQSLADDLSTFSGHALRLKDILAAADSRSLVLIDEIGAGTDPQEGASLSIAALERLTEARVPTVVTTHHGELKAFAHTTPGCANGSMAFDLKTLKPTYRFIPELPGSSYALEIAARVGLPADIIQRAREIHGRERSELSELIMTLTDKLNDYEGLVAGEQRRAQELKTYEEALRLKLERVGQREKDWRAEMRRQGEELLRQARREVEAVVKGIREADASRDAIRAAHQSLQRLEQNLRQKTREVSLDEVPQPPSREPPPDPIEKSSAEMGDWVLLEDGATRAQVQAVSSAGARLCVTVGAVQLWVDAARVKVIAPPEPERPPPRFYNLPDIPFELDVRGLDAAEAVHRTDNYIANAVASGRDTVGIIHGKGAGILMRHIRAFLKKSRFVESFRFGDYGEGDYGVTIVTLKKSL